jgi:hypothetical protein
MFQLGNRFEIGVIKTGFRSNSGDMQYETGLNVNAWVALAGKDVFQTTSSNNLFHSISTDLF